MASTYTLTTTDETTASFARLAQSRADATNEIVGESALLQSLLQQVRLVAPTDSTVKIKATIVTDDEHAVVEQSKFAFGQEPSQTPREVGVLLFLAPTQPQVTLASAEQPAEMLPETGSSLPLVGLMGTLAIAMSLGLWALRRTRTI